MTIETTQGTLLDGRVAFRQPAEGYRSAIDPILLAAAIPAKAGDRVFELGAGAGAAALCLLSRVPGCTVAGTEINANLRCLALANAADNGFHGRLNIADPGECGSLGGSPFDHLMSNPPFWERGEHPSPKPTKALAHHENAHVLENWIKQLGRYGKFRATITIVFPAARLADLMASLKSVAGDVTVLPFWPKRGREAKRVVVQARLGGKGPDRVLPGITLHRDDGQFTEAAGDILRGGVPIHMDA